MRIDYLGDVARISTDQRLLTDHFYNGVPWDVGLKRFVQEIRGGALYVTITPLRASAPIYLEDKLRLRLDAPFEFNEIRSVELSPEYQLIIDKSTPRTERK